MAGLKTKLQQLLAGFMAVWLSGFVFLFCCENMRAAAETADSCPLMKMSSHCDHMSNQANAGNSIEGLNPAVECCSFLPIVFDKSRKVDTVQKQVVAPIDEIKVETYRVPQFHRMSTEVEVLRSRVRDRHGTYIQNCVFRI